MCRCDILRCGHIAHFDCLRDSWKHSDYGMVPRCPTCRKSLFPPESVKPFWDAIRTSIQMQPLTSDILVINVGDEVSSPFGNFLVESIYDVPSGPAAADGDADRKQGGGHPTHTRQIMTSMCRGRLVSWNLRDGTSPQAIVRLSELRKDLKVAILCYDCEMKSKAAFHFLGLECGHCKGFNTTRI